MTTDNASQSAPKTTVGERLRQAREVAGLTAAEIAARQHLRPVVIEAIESGDYRRIDSELFLKGYVRAYASHVGIDPDSVLRQLDKELEPLREEQKARVEASPLVDIERRKRRKRRIAKIVLVLLILAGLFYGGSLYLAGREAPLMGGAEEAPTEEPESVDSTSLLVSDEDDTDSMPVDATSGSVVEQDGFSGSDDGSDGQMPVDSPSPESESVPEATGASDGIPESEDVEPVAGDEEGGSGLVVSEPDVTQAGTEQNIGNTADADTDAIETTALPASETDIASSPESSAGRLVVGFSDDCWVEVQDSSGRTLVAELRRAGETLDVTGNAPIRVVLGAVSSVSSLSYGGEPVSLSERRARNDRLVLNLPD